MVMLPINKECKMSADAHLCCDDSLITSIYDDIGLHDESVSVVIVGGGPHALAALAALQEGSLAFQQFNDDGMFQARIGFESLNKIGTGVQKTFTLYCTAR